MLIHVEIDITNYHLRRAREPLYSKSADIAGCLHLMRAQKYTILVYLFVIKGNIFVIILLLKIFFTDYCHIYPTVYLLNRIYVS